MTDSTSLPMNDSWGIAGAIGRCMLWLTALTQAVVIRGFFFPYVTTRNTFFRFCVEGALGVLLIVWFQRKAELRRPSDPILAWLAFFLMASAISGTLGYYRLHSMFGDFERMGGVWAWLHLLVFYAALRVLMRDFDWTVLFCAILVVADLLVGWGSFQYLPDRLRNPAFTTTLYAGSLIGNPGLMAPYLLLVLALCGWLVLMGHRTLLRIFAGLSGGVMLIGIAGSLNRSTQLGLATGIFVGGAIWLFGTRKTRRPYRAVSVAATMVIVLIALAHWTSSVAPAAFSSLTGRWAQFRSAPIDYSRTIQWKEAIEAFMDRPLTGYGPENHQIATSHHFHPRTYAVIGGGIFDRTHNAWLELLATSGLIGAITMLGIWAAAARTLLLGYRERKLTAGETAIFSGALAGYAVYLTFWFFDLNSVMVWICILAFLSSRVRGRLDPFIAADLKTDWNPRMRALAVSLAVITPFAAYLHGVVPILAARRLGTAAGNAPFEQRLDAFVSVMNSPAPQKLHTLPLYYRFLRDYDFAFRGNRNPQLVAKLDSAFARGMIEADRTIARSPEDDRSYVDAARFSILAGNHYRDVRYVLLAVDELKRATHISPRRPDARTLLANTYLALGDTAKALAQLDSALRWVPDFAPAYFYQATVSLARGNSDAAQRQLLAALAKKFAGNDDVYEKTVEALTGRGEFARAAALSRGFLETAYGPLREWREGTTANHKILTTRSEAMVNRLPLLYLQSEQPDSAIMTAFAYAAYRPTAAPAARALSAAIKANEESKWRGRESLVPMAAPTLATASSSAGG